MDYRCISTGMNVRVPGGPSMGKNSRHEEPNNQTDPRIPSGTDKGPVKRGTRSGSNTEERRIQYIQYTPPYLT